MLDRAIHGHVLENVTMVEKPGITLSIRNDKKKKK